MTRLCHGWQVRAACRGTLRLARARAGTEREAATAFSQGCGIAGECRPALLCTLQSDVLPRSPIDRLPANERPSVACPLVVQRGLALFPANRLLLQRCVHGSHACARAENHSLGLLSELAHSLHQRCIGAGLLMPSRSYAFMLVSGTRLTSFGADRASERCHQPSGPLCFGMRWHNHRDAQGSGICSSVGFRQPMRHIDVVRCCG